MKWALHFKQSTALWTDAKWLVEGVQAQLEQDIVSDFDENSDLWTVLAGLIQQLGHSQLWIKHAPSHLDPQLCFSPFEEWIALHNNRVDRVAAFASQNRPVQFQEAFITLLLRLPNHGKDAGPSALHALADCTAPGRALRSFEDDRDSTDEALVSMPETTLQDSYQDFLPLDWSLRIGNIDLGLPILFATQVLRFATTSSGQLQYRISFDLASIGVSAFGRIHCGVSWF